MSLCHCFIVHLGRRASAIYLQKPLLYLHLHMYVGDCLLMRRQEVTPPVESGTSIDVSATPTIAMTLFVSSSLPLFSELCLRCQQCNWLVYSCQAEESPEVSKEMLARMLSALMLNTRITVTIESTVCVRYRVHMHVYYTYFSWVRVALKLAYTCTLCM